MKRLLRSLKNIRLKFLQILIAKFIIYNLKLFDQREYFLLKNDAISWNDTKLETWLECFEFPLLESIVRITDH